MNVAVKNWYLKALQQLYQTNVKQRLVICGF